MVSLPVMSDIQPFSEREQEILRLLDDGLSDREIAYKLALALGTVKWYNRQIYDKLGVTSRTQAVARARQLHLMAGSTASDVQPTPIHTLPAQTTHLIGRQHEIAEAQRLLKTVRLLTLTGPPGTGKTRLALEVAGEIAHQFADSVHFVPLSPISDASLIANAIAGVLKVEEVVSEPLMDTLKAHLHTKHLLLVLDNFEHLLMGAMLVSELLAHAPLLKVLVTSRAPLSLYGETEYFVPPLALPSITDEDTISELTCEAVALFVQRTQAVKPGFELTQKNALDIAKICVRLDGLPLAIELAAARSKLLPPGVLLERLSSRLATLVGGARDLPPRQQTLRNTIDWSYDLLNDAEKRLFARLSVFAGGWSLEAAEQVCSTSMETPVLDGLSALVDQGLVQQYETSYGEPRFIMLETIREYALECFDNSGEVEAVRGAHADYFTDFVERMGKTLDTTDHAKRLSQMEIEQNNIRAVLGWALKEDVEAGLRLIAAVGICWRIRSYMVEGFHWAQRLLDKGLHAAPEVRSRALSSTGTLLACHLGNFIDAEQMSQEALALAQQSGDSSTLAAAWYARGSALIEIDPAMAAVAIDNALHFYRDLDERWELARSLNIKGEVLRLGGHYEAAKILYDEALSIFRALGNPWGINIVLNNRAAVAQHEGDFERARALLTDALKISSELKDRCSISGGLDRLAGVLGVLKQPRQAARLFGAAEALRERIGAHIQAGERVDYERSVAAVREQLDDDSYETVWAEGRQMTLEHALEAAMSSLDAL